MYEMIKTVLVLRTDSLILHLSLGWYLLDDDGPSKYLSVLLFQVRVRSHGELNSEQRQNSAPIQMQMMSDTKM